MKRILSIDGGGIRGIIPAMVLAHLEDQADFGSVADHFDLIAGTSTGSIIAAALARPESRTKKSPKFAARDLVNLYLERGHEIFHRSFWKGVSSVWGVSDEKYPHEPLQKILIEYLEDFRLREALKPVLLSSYDIERREPRFFKSWHDDTSRLPMWEAVRSSTAAPTYFEPHLTEINGVRAALVDGGVFANNPAMCAYAEAKRMWPDEEELLVVSLGTGHHTRRIPYEDAKDWGKLEWVVPILSVVFDGVSDAVDYQLSYLLRSERYFRFDRSLGSALDDMDNASKSNLIALQQEAAGMIQDSRARIAELLPLL